MQASFWEQLRADESIAGLNCLMNVYNAISETGIELRTDITDGALESDEFLKLLWKRHLERKSEVVLYESVAIESPISTPEDLSAAYLTSNDNLQCDGLGMQFGVLVVNALSIPKKEYLFKGQGFLLKKNETYEDGYKQFASEICHPINAMILIDPYLLAKKENLTNNLFGLLDTILPTKKLQIPFQLSIFSMIGEDGDGKQGKEVYDAVSNLIKATRKGLNFNLTIYAIGKAEEFHRRMIITNNVLMSADDGFNVFQDNGQAGKNATFNVVFPRLYGDSRKDWSNYTRWIRITKNRSDKQSDSMCWGSKENRLFDLI